MDHEEFFNRYRRYGVQGVNDYGPRTVGSIEDLYQAFKARMIAELLVDVHNCPVYGRLVAEDKEQ